MYFVSHTKKHPNKKGFKVLSGKLFVGVWLFLLVLTIPGCAYYNTFYLAKKNYNDAERQRQKDKGTVRPNTKKMYRDAIDWSYVILRSHMDSKYVDDSLYIIGMSNYYMEEYTKARTKFDELLQAFPESDLAPTATFFKAKCLDALGEDEQAVSILLDLINNSGSSLQGMAALAIADMSFASENWKKLEIDAQRVIDLDPDKQELFKAYYYKGEAQYNLGQFEDSVETLRKLSKEKIETELRFKVNTLISMSLAELGRFDEALESLSAMRGKGEYERYAPQIRLEMGNIFIMMNDEEQAITTFMNLAGDYPDSIAAKEAWYNIGILRLRDLANAVQAKEAFDMVQEGSARTNESWFVEARIKSIQLDSLISKTREIERLKDILEGRKREGSEPDGSMQEKPNDNAASSAAAAAGIESESANQSASRDTSTADTVVAVTDSASAGDGVAESDSTVASAPEKLNKTEVARQSLTRTRFALAELLTYSFARPDSALTQYRLILEENPESEFAVKSQYFLGMNNLEKNGTVTEEAEKQFMLEIIEKYPKSEFAQELKVFLGIIESPPDVKAFVEAEHARMNGEPPDVYIPLFEKITEEYPDTKSAYHAKFLAAYYLEHELGDKKRAFELYTELSEEPETVNSEKFVKLAKDKLQFAERENDLLAEVSENIAYYELRIREIETGEDLIGDSGFTGRAGASVGAGVSGYSGLQKIRARNARIRSRYYTQ